MKVLPIIEHDIAQNSVYNYTLYIYTVFIKKNYSDGNQ